MGLYSDKTIFGEGFDNKSKGKDSTWKQLQVTVSELLSEQDIVC